MPPLCVACRAPAGSRPLCAECRRALEHLPASPVALAGLRVWAPVAYRGPGRALVGRLKFHGAGRLADYMAAAIAARVPAGLLGGALVAVPGRRGHDHAAALARALGKRTGLEVLAPLIRRGGPRQVGRPRAARLGSPPRFEARDRAKGTDPFVRRVVLVDDVITTGATLGACARALRKTGWICESAVAYARTPG